MEWFRKHTDTVIISGASLLVWYDERFKDVKRRLDDIQSELDKEKV